MSNLPTILEFNQKFVASKAYEPFRTDRYPNKKMVILTCMDTRLTELLPRAMDIHNGDVKIIKTAGAVVAHPFGSVMRSILVAIYGLDADEVLVVGHHDCGMTGMSAGPILKKARESGVSETTIETLRHAGVDLEQFLRGFASVEEAVRNSVSLIRNHPLITREISVDGLVIHPETGMLEVVTTR